MRDKFLHVAAGALICAPFAWFGYPAVGVVLAGIIGAEKEAYDVRGNGTPELADLMATVIGAIAVAACFA